MLALSCALDLKAITCPCSGGPTLQPPPGAITLDGNGYVTTKRRRAIWWLEVILSNQLLMMTVRLLSVDGSAQATIHQRDPEQNSRIQLLGRERAGCTVDRALPTTT